MTTTQSINDLLAENLQLRQELGVKDRLAWELAHVIAEDVRVIEALKATVAELQMAVKVVGR